MLSRITAKMLESWQPKEKAMDRAQAYFKQAQDCQANAEKDQALSYLIKAKAALKTIPQSDPKILEAKRLLTEIHITRAQVLQLPSSFTEEDVRTSLNKAKAYSPDAVKRDEIDVLLAQLPRAQLQRRPTIPPSAVPPAPVPITGGLPDAFFTPSSSSAPVTQNYQLVDPDKIENTRHLAWCLQQTNGDTAQRTRLFNLAREVTECFGKWQGKDLICMHEAAELAVVPHAEIYRLLITHAAQALNPMLYAPLNSAAVQGLAVMVRNCPAPLLKKDGGVRADTLASLLNALLTRLDKVHKGDPVPVKELIEAISQLLDAMGQAGVSGISRLQLQKPLADLLRDGEKLNPLKDNDLAWQIRYAREALAYIPNDESTGDAVLRCLFAASKGVLGLASAIKSCDVDKLLESFDRFETAFDGAKEVANTVGATGGLKEAVKNAEEMLASFGEVKTSYEDRTRQKGWYTALQCLDMLIETKEWEKFEQFVRKSDYRHHAYFLQGVCQRLERIVCVEADQGIQAQAIQFLKSLKDDAAQWLGKQGVGLSFSRSDSERIQQQAQASLARLEKRDAPSIANRMELSLDWYDLSTKPLGIRLLEKARGKLAENSVKQLFDILRVQIDRLRTDYFADLAQDREIKDALANYVPPEGMSLHNDDRFDLAEKIQAFLASDKKSLLLLGEAGAGKSTLNRYVARDLWQAATPETLLIPVFIPLSSLPNTSLNLVDTFFKQQGFSEEQIRTLQTDHRFVLILDGFDEIEDRHRDFYRDNQLDKWRNAKIIISSRPEYLGAGYQYKFHPSGEPTALQEYRLAPFSPAAIARYVELYSQNHPAATWSVEDYQQALQEPNVQALVSNPFLLKMAVSELPALGAAGLPGHRLTRLTLYAQFVSSWFARSQQRLGKIQLDAKEKEEFKRLERDGFYAHQMSFNQELAIHMYQAGEVVSHYTKKISSLRGRNPVHDEQDWRAQLLNHDEIETKLKCLNAPLIIQDAVNGVGKTTRFIHKSVRDYFVAKTLWEAFDAQSGLAADDWFNTLDLVDDPAILDFLVDKVKQEETFKAQLLNVIERTKTEPQFAQGAANAITVLVRAEVQLNGANLSGIRIPGANLSYGVFDSVQWLGADLRKVDLTGAWLRNTDLSGARMEGVEFGELPGLQLENEVKACCYSSDGRLLVVAHGGTVTVYDAHTLEEKRRLVGHEHWVTSVVMSANGRYVVSGSWDKTVRVWDWQTSDTAHRVLSGHWREVNSVAMSADGRYVVSGSRDTTVRVWDWQTSDAAHRVLPGQWGQVDSVAMSADGRYVVSGSCETVRVWDWQTSDATPRVLSGHQNSVDSVVMSPDGRYVVSGSRDNTVRVWDWQTSDAALRVLRHEHGVMSVGMSADGRYVVSGSWDENVRMWDWQTSDATLRILSGHQSSVDSVVMSPDGRYVVSGSRDTTVRVWDWQTSAAAPRVLRGHQDWVSSAVMSADGRYVVSGSGDKTVQVWDWQTSAAAPRVFSGHGHGVMSVVMSADGRYVVSGGHDNTVRVWDWQTSDAALRVLRGHEGSVISVVISADGRYVVSGSQDKTVRVWEWQTSDAALRVFSGHEYGVNSVAMSADGRYVVSGSGDPTVRVWDWQTSDAALRVLPGQWGQVDSVVMSADGRYVVFGSDDHTVRVWEWQTSDAALRVLSGHEHGVRSVVMSPDGRYVVSGSHDKTVRVWDIASGQCLAIIHGFNGVVYSVAWQNIDGVDYLITGSSDKAVRCWQLIPAEGQWQARLRWTSNQAALTAVGAKIEEVEGLSPMNSRLLKQRDAIGEPRQIKEEESPPSLIESAETSALMIPIQTDSRYEPMYLNLA